MKGLAAISFSGTLLVFPGLVAGLGMSGQVRLLTVGALSLAGTHLAIIAGRVVARLRGSSIPLSDREGGHGSA